MIVKVKRLLLGAMVIGPLGFSTARADNVINDDLIVIGNACIGTDCVDNETFQSNGVKLKENNTRLDLGGGDFILTANQNNNGGLNEFRIDTALPSVSGDGAAGVSTNVPVISGATLMPDGTLRVDLSVSPNAVALSTPELTDGTLTPTNQYAYIPAGSFTEFSPNTGIYFLTAGVPVTSDTGATFAYTGSGNVSNVSFAAGGTGVTLGRGSTRTAGTISVGSAGAERRVTEVEDAQNTDELINMRQLRSAIAPLDLSSMIEAESGRLESVSAMTAALSAVQPNPRASGRLATSFGLGFYEGETAGAVGVTWRANNNILMKFSVADGNQSAPMTALSINFAW